MKLLSRTALSAVMAVALIPAVAVSAANAATPSNDAVSGATVIGSLPTTITQDTTQATTDAVDAALNADCGAPATNASVWFEYTDVAGAGFIATMENSDYSGGFFVTEGDPSLADLRPPGGESATRSRGAATPWRAHSATSCSKGK